MLIINQKCASKLNNGISYDGFPIKALQGNLNYREQ